MTYDSGYTSPGDSETLVSYIISNIRSERCIVISLGKFDLLLHCSSDGWYIGFDSKPFLSQSNIFISSPRRIFICFLYASQS